MQPVRRFLTQVVETESSRDALRKTVSNLQRRLAEIENELRLKEKSYQLSLDESRRNERKLDEHCRQREVTLERANADLHELRLKLGASEGRVSALEGQLVKVDGAKQDTEFKLSSIVSCLRRSIGFSQGVVRSAGPTRTRSPSPLGSKPSSPTKGTLKYFHTLHIIGQDCNMT